MGRDEWFRNTAWTEDIEKASFGKLARAKRKAQYLRIQVCILAPEHPLIALRLLEKYFELGTDYDEAQAYVDRATAYLSLGETGKAVESYEAALAVEKKRPHYQTRVYVSLPFLIACAGIRLHYERALNVLREHKSRLMFPVDHFQWHAAYALISMDLGDAALAREHARLALDAAAKDDSGFRYHPTVGLVGNKYEAIRERLFAAAA